jgi:DnaJ-class molecular chaperone
MSRTTLQKLMDDARVEMGPEVFREFTDDLAGRKKPQPRQRKNTCAICAGSGKAPEQFGGGKCAGCDGTGKF